MTIERCRSVELGGAVGDDVAYLLHSTEEIYRLTNLVLRSM